ncbi:MAG: hypothetical protein WKF65_14270 [Gaiellaceae bacterium]
MLVHVFSGAVSDPEPGQDVEIVGEDCGVRGSRLIAATKTTAGGAFQADNQDSSTPWSSGITYRARWKGNLSAPVQYRLPAVPVYAVKVRKRVAWRVHFSPQALTVRYAGKPVELQRFSNGEWVRFQASRLTLKPSLRYGAFNHEAEFSVPRRGLRLRGYLPPVARRRVGCRPPRNPGDPRI